MPDDHISQHLREEVSEICPRCDARDEGFIALFGGLQIEAMIARIIKVIALRTPGFVIHLLPLFTGRDSYLDSRRFQLAATRPRGWRHRRRWWGGPAGRRWRRRKI